jgi:hypothetical protein
MDLSASLPRSCERIDMRYQWIARLLGNEHIDTDAVMAPFAREILQRASADGQRLVPIIDQTQANETRASRRCRGARWRALTPDRMARERN